MLKSITTKTGLVLLLGLCSFWFTGCNGSDEDPETDELVVDDDYYEFQDFKLDDYDIDAIISLPDETANIGASTKPEVAHDESFKWEISVGPNFQLMIEDFGSITGLVEEKKKDLANQKFFEVKYLIDEEGMILYERTLVVAGSDKASPTVGVEHKTYHVYAERKIGDVIYVLKSREEGYEKMIIELMAKSIKSFKSPKES